MPADTPAAVTTFPRCTTLVGVGRAPSAARRSIAAQCPVASTPSSTPAAARNSEPVHTLVVQVVVGCTARIHRTTGSSEPAGCTIPPGTTITSGAVTSAKRSVATSASRPV